MIFESEQTWAFSSCFKVIPEWNTIVYVLWSAVRKRVRCVFDSLCALRCVRVCVVCVRSSSIVDIGSSKKSWVVISHEWRVKTSDRRSSVVDQTSSFATRHSPHTHSGTRWRSLHLHMLPRQFMKFALLYPVQYLVCIMYGCRESCVFDLRFVFCFVFYWSYKYQLLGHRPLSINHSPFAIRHSRFHFHLVYCSVYYSLLDKSEWPAKFPLSSGL